jgi:AraC family transcriptional regulator
MQVTIVMEAAARLIGLELEDGKVELIPALWDRFNERMGEIESNQPGFAYGVCRGMPGQDFAYLAGVRAAPDAPIPPGMKSWDLPAQKYAVFLHRGYYREIPETYGHIFNGGLAQNHLTPVPEIGYERYEFVRCPNPDGPHSEVDLYVPVA